MIANRDAYATIYAEKTGVSLEVARLVTGREEPALMPPTDAVIGELQRVADAFAAEKVLPAPVAIAPLVVADLFPTLPS